MRGPDCLPRNSATDFNNPINTHTIMKANKQTLRLLRGTAAHHLRRLARIAAACLGYDYRRELQRRLDERHDKIRLEKQSYPLFSQVQATHFKAIG